MQHLSIAVLLFLFSVSALAEKNEAQVLSSAQKWVLGITGGLLLVSAGGNNKNPSIRNGRKIVALSGLAVFTGVTIYENKKNRTSVSLSHMGDTPVIAFNKTF